MFRRKTVIIDPVTLAGNQADFINPTITKPIGVSLPFNNPNGIFFKTVTNRDQVLSNLKNLLLTSKGERYFQPEFGTDIRRVLFENITDESQFKNSLKGEIESAIGRWLPYLFINQLTITLNMSEDGRVVDPNHVVGIFLRVIIKGTNIYLPIRIFISEMATIRITEEAQN